MPTGTRSTGSEQLYQLAEAVIGGAKRLAEATQESARLASNGVVNLDAMVWGEERMNEAWRRRQAARHQVWVELLLAVAPVLEASIPAYAPGRRRRARAIHARTLLARGNFAYLQGDLENALRALREALQIFQALSMDVEVFRAEVLLASVLLQRETHEEGLTLAIHASGRRVARTDHVRRSEALLVAGASAYALGDSAGDDHFEEAIEEARRATRPSQEARVKLAWARAGLAAGRLARVPTLTDEAAKLYSGLGDKTGGAAVAELRARVVAAEGDLPLAAERMRVTAERFVEAGSNALAVACRVQAARWVADAGDLPAARTMLRELRSDVTALHSPVVATAWNEAWRLTEPSPT